MKRVIDFAAIVLLSLPAVALAQTYAGDVGIEKEEVRLGAPEYSPYLNRSYPDRVLWGDTHVHTSYSTDAGMIGNFLGPDEAFRFARGEIVRASGGQRAKLIRPLDFLVVADHAENLGLATMIAESDPNLLRIPWGKKVHDLVKAGDAFGAYVAWGTKMAAGEDPLGDDVALDLAGAAPDGVGQSEQVVLHPSAAAPGLARFGHELGVGPEDVEGRLVEVDVELRPVELHEARLGADVDAVLDTRLRPQPVEAVGLGLHPALGDALG